MRRYIIHAFLAGVALPGLASCSSGPSARVFQTRDPGVLASIDRALKAPGTKIFSSIDATLDGEPLRLVVSGWSHESFPEARYLPPAEDAPELERWLLIGWVDPGWFERRWRFYLYGIYAPEDKPYREHPSGLPVAGGLILSNEGKFTGKTHIGAKDIERAALQNVELIRRARTFRIVDDAPPAGSEESDLASGARR